MRGVLVREQLAYEMEEHEHHFATNIQAVFRGNKVRLISSPRRSMLLLFRLIRPATF